MSFIYITGIAGTGKSTICGELLRRGYEAYDADNELCGYYSVDTGTITTSTAELAVRTLEWRRAHSWRMSRERLINLKQCIGSGIVFLCGNVENTAEVNDLFDKVVPLVIDDDTLRLRIEGRTNNDFGKLDHELSDLLLANKARRIL